MIRVLLLSISVMLIVISYPSGVFPILISLFSTVLPADPVNPLLEYPILLQWIDVGGLPLLISFIL